MPPFSQQSHLSPNRSVIPAHERRGVCFHHSVLTYRETIDFMSKPESRVSYHVLIAPDGTRALLVDERAVAWHAGVSRFRGREHCNDFLLGVSFAGDTYISPLTGLQLESALDWLEPRWHAFGWSIDWMTDHRQIAPGRKNDLNPVEWIRLESAIRRRLG